MDIIQQTLGTEYAMFYCDHFESTKLTPVQTWPQCVDIVNNALAKYGTTVDAWPESLKNLAAKLVRAHVIYQTLPVEPIRKPMLIHKQHDTFVVDCGDTRLMALSQLPEPGLVSVIATCRIDAVNQYQNWIPIHSVADLARCTGFKLESNTVQITPTSLGADYAVCWIEFGDQTTAHHLHDVQQRLNMIQDYLDQQPEDFQFDQQWLLTPINWNL